MYLYFNCFYQGGYGNGPIQQCAATLIGIGDGHNPGFVAHAQSMYNGVADVCGAGMISVAHNDDSGTTLFTALNNIADLFSGAHYAKGQQFRVGNAVMCFFLT